MGRARGGKSKSETLERLEEEEEEERARSDETICLSIFSGPIPRYCDPHEPRDDIPNTSF